MGAFAWAVEKAVNRQFFPPGCPIQMAWDVPEVEDLVKRRTAEGMRVAYLSEMVKSGMMERADALEQVLDDGILTIKPAPGVIEPGIRGLPAAPTPEKRYPEYPDAMTKSEAARLAARVIEKSVLLEETEAYSDMQSTLREQLFSKRKSDKRREGITAVVSKLYQ